MEEPERNTGAAPTRTPLWKTVWFWGGVAIVVAAVIGIAAGMTLGGRQGGPLGSQTASGGRPTIVVATAAAAPAASAVPSPSPVALASPGTVAGAAATAYVVQPGDTLRSIAQEQYGDAEQWPKIYDANRDVIGADPDALIAGTKLVIPR